MQKISIILVILLAITISDSMSQDLDYAQHYNNPTYYNPANVGLTMGL